MVARALCVSAFLVAASGASAATVSSFYATAYSGATIRSAHYSGTTTDARDEVDLTAWRDDGDYGYPWLRGDISVSRFLSDPPGGGEFDFVYGHELWGHSDTTGMAATGRGAGYSTPAFAYREECSTRPWSCADGPSIDLTIDYYLRADAEASVTDQEGQSRANAFAEVTFFTAVAWRGDQRPSGFRETVSASAAAWPDRGQSEEVRSSNERHGTLTFTLEPGQILGLDLYTKELSGAASVVPVPAPWALPMLGAALVGWVAVPRRGRRGRRGGAAPVSRRPAPRAP